MNAAEELHHLRNVVREQEQRIKRLKLQRDKARLARRTLAEKIGPPVTARVVTLTLVHPEFPTTAANTQHVLVQPGERQEVTLQAMVSPANPVLEPYRITTVVLVSVSNA